MSISEPHGKPAAGDEIEAANPKARPHLRELSKLHASTAREVGEKNRILILFWLMKWGWTTNQVVQRILNVQRPRPADEFVKKGILEKLESKPGWIERSVYILSPAGVAAANRYLKKLGIEDCRNYNLHITKRIPWSSHEHHIIAQHLIIDFEPWLFDFYPGIEFFNSFKTDYELDSDKSDGVFIADFIVYKQDEESDDYGDYKNLHYEVELNEKTKDKLWKWAWLRAMHLKKNPSDEIIILTPHNRIKVNYKKYFSEKIPKPIKFNGKPSADPAQGMYLTDEFGKLYLERLEFDETRRTGGLRRDDEGFRDRAMSKRRRAAADPA